jgi:threonine dehydrogenase-like Zn-dependent dehydrogenase
MATTLEHGDRTMKAIQFDAYGEPAEVLAVADRPIPEPGNGEARVRVLATPINPSDLLYVRGVYSGVEPRFPAPVGFEGVGIVDALGPEANGVVVGQRVAVINGQGGNWAEYAARVSSRSGCLHVEAAAASNKRPNSARSARNFIDTACVDTPSRLLAVGVGLDEGDVADGQRVVVVVQEANADGLPGG